MVPVRRGIISVFMMRDGMFSSRLRFFELLTLQERSFLCAVSRYRTSCSPSIIDWKMGKACCADLAM